MIIYAGMSVVVVSKFNYEGMLKSIMRHKISHLLFVAFSFLLNTLTHLLIALYLPTSYFSAKFVLLSVKKWSS